MEIENLESEKFQNTRKRDCDYGKFLHFDNACPKSRVLLFFSKHAINVLKNHPATMFFDATFYAAPVNFYQLMTIHGSYNGTSYLIGFSLMQDKTEANYKLVLQQLKEQVLEYQVAMNPKKILYDSEKALQNALAYHFPEAQVLGCWFHFCQSIYRRAVCKCFGRKAFTNAHLKTFVSQFTALPLIPLENLNEAMSLIKSSIQKVPQR